MPAICTSRRTRSGGSVATRSSASGPDDAELSEKPAGSRIASSSRTFAATSSTTRIRGGGSVSAVISRPQVAAHLVGQLSHLDRLLQVAVEALGQEALFVAAHRRGGMGDDRDLGRPRILLERLERLRAAQIGHPDVHQDQVGDVLLGHCDALDSAGRLEGAEAGELEHVARQLPVVRVVVDDEDDLPGHHASCRTGRVKRNVLPRPTSLSTQSRPPCSSTSFRESGRPRPVPSARLPSEVCSNSSKIVSNSSAEIPGPVSATAISTSPSSSRAEMSIRPSRGVNLTALEIRLKTTWRRRRSSAVTVISSGSVIRVSSIPPRLARSECMETALLRTSGIATRESSRSMRPVSFLARLSNSLMTER